MPGNALKALRGGPLRRSPQSFQQSCPQKTGICQKSLMNQRLAAFSPNLGRQAQAMFSANAPSRELKGLEVFAGRFLPAPYRPPGGGRGADPHGCWLSDEVPDLGVFTENRDGACQALNLVSGPCLCTKTVIQLFQRTIWKFCWGQS